MLAFFKDDINETQAGVDEVGRGCFMGPVVACAVVWDTQFLIDESQKNNSELLKIKDSKKLSEKQRESTASFITTHCKAYAIEAVDAKEIDETNILRATYTAMHRCVDKILQKTSVDRLLVDGNRFDPYRDIKHECVIDGDNHFLNIASASILAKVYRDTYVKELCIAHPEYEERYNWSNNKGYGTKKHIEGIKTWGLTPYHRKTFGICKKMSC